ncbi:MAG: mobile mystery protein B [Saprospiraceae bacterium]
MNLQYEEGQTPINEDEKQGLKIKSISTMGELDEFEQQNIENAVEWVHGRSFNLDKVLDVAFIQDVHRRMLKDVWKWAGQFRWSDKNLGVSYYRVRQDLQILLDDCRYWISKGTFSSVEIAVRFKHRLVSIHLFPNGNGRHSRLMGDILLKALDSDQSFSWGSRSLRHGEDRIEYLKALRQADNDNIAPLIEFSQK